MPQGKTKSHRKNADTILDEGNPNEVTAADARTHLDDDAKHRLINDAGSSTTELLSSDKIISEDNLRIKKDGSEAFTGAVSGVSPTIPSHLTTKGYVDGLVSGIVWQEPIIDKDLTAPPGGETAGDRYVVASVATGAWATHEDDVAEWNGSSWDFTTPTEGFATWALDEDKLYVFVTSWQIFGSVLDHQNLIGAGTNTHAQIDTHLGDATTHFTEASIVHNNIASIQGGSAGQRNHLTDAQVTLVNDALQNLIEDLTPQLGGNLDVNGKQFTGDGVFVNKLTVQTRDVKTSSALSAEVHVLADLPTPSGGVITLQLVHTDNYRASITLSDRFVIPGSANDNINISSDEFNQHFITYTGSVTLFTGDGIAFFNNFRVALLNGNTGTAFNIMPGPNPLAQVALQEILVAGFASLGNISARPFFANCAFVDNVIGLSLTNATDLRLLESIWQNTSDLGTTFLTLDGTKKMVGTIEGTTGKMKASESMFYISPSIAPDSSITISKSNFEGNVFKSGATGSITAIADASVSGSVIGVSSGVDGAARFETSVAHGMFDDQQVEHTTFTDTDYNGTRLDIVVIDATHYDVPEIDFAATDTGSFNSDSIEITSATHGLLDGEAVQVKDVVNHLGGSILYNSLTNTFQVNIPFSIATETGNWDTGSLDQTDPRVNSVDPKTGIPASNSVGSFNVENNVAITDFSLVTPGDYIPLNFGAGTPAVLGLDSELFIMVNPLTGRMRYIGLPEIKPTSRASISTEKIGGVAAEYLFRVTVNDVDGAPIANELKNTMGNTGLVKGITLNTGDEIQLEGANITGTDNLVARYINFNVK